MKYSILIILPLLLLISGCSLITRPMEQPVIEEKLNRSFLSEADVGTLSLTPDRRVVLVNFENKKFCAEAPTEVGADLSNLIKATANASKGDEFKAGASAIIAATSSNSVLNRRTQGMQLFLANSYFICQMYMNNAIKERELLELQFRALDAIAPLIEKEIEFMYTQTPNGTQAYKPLDINKLLNESLGEETPKVDNGNSVSE